MAKKKGKQRESSGPGPKRLRKQFRKAEARLGKAVAKRDKAQARVEALGIIADEIRAQLADIDKAAAKAVAAEVDAKAAAAKPAPRKTAPKKAATTGAKSATPASTRKPAATKKPAAGTKPATTRTYNGARTPKSD